MYTLLHNAIRAAPFSPRKKISFYRGRSFPKVVRSVHQGANVRRRVDSGVRVKLRRRLARKEQWKEKKVGQPRISRSNGAP